MKSIPKLTFLLFAIALSGCITNKKLTYLQPVSATAETITAAETSDYLVQPYDNLYIRVVTPDPQWSQMFNTMPTTTYSISVTEQSADLISYPVDGSGAITLPYVGKIMVAGKTLGEISTDIEKSLTPEYIADADVTVKLINNYISLLGEVQRPGKYPIYKERLNIFQALAMGGDLGDFSNRQMIQVIRQTDGGNVIREFSLTDRDIMSSEFFYVMPNDVIYAKPIKGKFFRMNEFPYTIILTTLSTFLLFLNVLK